MSRPESAGALFRRALAEENPLQVIGAINANHALLAKRAGFRAIYLSGGGVAAGSLGLPDLGINTLDDVLTDVRRITDVCDLPLLVDIDTGFGPSAFNIARTVKSLIKFGAAAMPHRGPGRRQALRPSAGQGNRQHRGDGRPRQGRRRCPHRQRLLPDRAHRRHRLARRGRRHRARPAPASRPAPTPSSPKPPTTCRPTTASSMR